VCCCSPCGERDGTDDRRRRHLRLPRERDPLIIVARRLNPFRDMMIVGVLGVRPSLDLRSALPGMEPSLIPDARTHLFVSNTKTNTIV
jgi:hypothetical protein